MTGHARALRRRLPDRRRWRDHLITVGWLVAVWSLLWGEFTVGNLLAGVLAAVVILVFLPLPRVTFGGGSGRWRWPRSSGASSSNSWSPACRSAGSRCAPGGPGTRSSPSGCGCVPTSTWR
ncbi:hypothetical protein [Plantactinospora veratri]